MISELSDFVPNGADPARKLQSRGVFVDFHRAFRGIKLGIRSHSVFCIFFFASSLALIICLGLRCSVIEWCLIIGCIGIVTVSELFKSAIEMIATGLDPETRSRWKHSLNIASGAVLTAIIFAIIVGTIVFANRFGILLKWW